MAKDTSRTPWIFDATTQTDDQTGPIKIGKIICRNGSASAADFTILDRSGGREVLQKRVPATDEEESDFAGSWVEGLYIQAIPATSVILVYPDENVLVGLPGMGR